MYRHTYSIKNLRFYVIFEVFFFFNERLFAPIKWSLILGLRVFHRAGRRVLVHGRVSFHTWQKKGEKLYYVR